MSRTKKANDKIDITKTKCPYCGGKVEIKPASTVREKAEENEFVCICKNYPQCDAYVSCHAGTKNPMGELADRNLRLLRQKAHKHFDRLYKSNMMTRSEAYRWLCLWTQAPNGKAHIGSLREYYCNVVIRESDNLFNKLKKQKNTSITNYRSYKSVQKLA